MQNAKLYRLNSRATTTPDMGAILLNIPDIPDTDLVFDENETRRILKFFWPSLAADIDAMKINNDTRRLAQTALIAAIDGSYALGFIDALLQTAVRPGPGIKSFAKKLARRFVRHWWKHTERSNLENVRIYDSVRKSVARSLNRHLDLVLQGLALNRCGLIHTTAMPSCIVWA